MLSVMCEFADTRPAEWDCDKEPCARCYSEDLQEEADEHQDAGA